MSLDRSTTKFVRNTLLALALLFLTGWLVGVMFPTYVGFWLGLPALYWVAYLTARWLWQRRLWKRVRKDAEVDDLDKEWELYNK